MGEGWKPRKTRITFFKVFKQRSARHRGPGISRHQGTVEADTALRPLGQPLSPGILCAEAWRPGGGGKEEAWVQWAG